MPAVVDAGRSAFQSRIIAAELVRDHNARPPVLLEQLAEKAFRCASDAPRLNQNIKNVTIAVDRAPKPKICASGSE